MMSNTPLLPNTKRLSFAYLILTGLLIPIPAHAGWHFDERITFTEDSPSESETGNALAITDSDHANTVESEDRIFCKAGGIIGEHASVTSTYGASITKRQRVIYTYTQESQYEANEGYHNVQYGIEWTTATTGTNTYLFGSSSGGTSNGTARYGSGSVGIDTVQTQQDFATSPGGNVVWHTATITAWGGASKSPSTPDGNFKQDVFSIEFNYVRP